MARSDSGREHEWQSILARLRTADRGQERDGSFPPPGKPVCRRVFRSTMRAECPPLTRLLHDRFPHSSADRLTPCSVFCPRALPGAGERPEAACPYFHGVWLGADGRVSAVVCTFPDGYRARGARSAAT